MGFNFLGLFGGDEKRPRLTTSQKDRLAPDPNYVPPESALGNREERLAALGPNPTPEDRYRAIRTKLTPAQRAGAMLAATAPPPLAQEAESDAYKAAGAAARRTRRRAKAGHAGRVTTGPGATQGVGAGGTARALIGY